ncbi:hypothetical protein FR483_n235R [Paramecium bursaria Chlorella virus FR483]|uniref:Uncharacterized protein n235R n=1 Tax=Paramecium bursaria Chlorella virus FR483 TaxID=399781 RepID=A7J6T9_PBCVF|nr:hypothetical protein FR483_n235R [Paramecium bursaria Chlorella virus FR483]ABT15520.1 hypothetical protein FR483_n235R [Paramecium bursaria Chlorella virus FR483]
MNTLIVTQLQEIVGSDVPCKVHKNITLFQILVNDALEVALGHLHIYKVNGWEFLLEGIQPVFVLVHNRDVARTKLEMFYIKVWHRRTNATAPHLENAPVFKIHREVCLVNIVLINIVLIVLVSHFIHLCTQIFFNESSSFL